METYAQNAKYNLINAKNEISSILNMIDDSITINDKPLSKSEIQKMYSNINLQINNLNNYIIPAIRRMDNE